MATVHEQASDRFYNWEVRGRGLQLFPTPVYPEPAFIPFEPDSFQGELAIDDGRKPTFLSSFARGLERKISGPPPLPPLVQVLEPEPVPLIRDQLTEFRVLLPDNLDLPIASLEPFFITLSLCQEPIAFEIIAIQNKISFQFAAEATDACLVYRQLTSHFPDLTFISQNETLAHVWSEIDAAEILVVEFGLGCEFMMPLATPKTDPLVGLLAAISNLAAKESALFQLIWQPVQSPWAESIVRSVSHEDGRPFFLNRPELTKAAENKVSRPLFATVVRLVIQAETFERILALGREVAGSLRVFTHPHGNHLIPLKNTDYAPEDHLEDVLYRQTRRSGMLLNSEELSGFVHFPSAEIRIPALARQTTKTKAAPGHLINSGGIVLGTNEHAGETVTVHLTPEQRVRHCHIIGASGTGKSTLLFNLIKQDIEAGQGIAVLDPHGDLIDRVLGEIPDNRVEDVVLVDPSDEEYSVGFNILSAHSELEKTLLASDLVAVFERLSTTWGDQMNSVLQNALLAFLESTRAGTIADVRRFLVEPRFRSEFLTTVRDSEVLYYWQKSFPQLVGNKSIGSILTRLDAFLSKKPIRYMVAQRENRLDFAEIMDTGKIFLAKLPEGLLGRENSYLLGALIVSKFQQIAMSRQAQSAGSRRNFWFYIDEFANFITPSMAEILSGARKYRIGLTLAHHELHQLDRDKEVASAVMTHPCTRIVFRVGDDDARKLADGFSHFEAKDLRNLHVGQAVCRVERSDYDFNLAVGIPPEPNPAAAVERRQQAIRASRQKYSNLRWEIDKMLAAASITKIADIEEEKRRPTPEVPKAPPAEDASEAKQVQVDAPKQSVPDATKEASESKSKANEVGLIQAETKPGPQHQSTPELSPPAQSSQNPQALGIGGPDHKAIQALIKTEGQKLGFRCSVEYRIPKTKNKIDVVLERDDVRIACEVPVGNTTEYEVGNVEKCIRAGFTKIAIVSDDTEHLRKIAAKVAMAFGSQAKFASFYAPEQFIAFLKTIPNTTKTPTDRIVRGYKIKHLLPKSGDLEQSKKEAIAYEAMLRALRAKA